MKKLTYISLLALCLCLSGCGKKDPVQPSATNTEATKSEPTNEVKTPSATPKGINQTSNVKVGTPIWEFETGDAVDSSPAIGSDGTVYVGPEDKKLYSLSGKPLT